MSQTAVNDGAGARSPMAAIGTAVTVILTLPFLVPVFSYPPEAALGALVFVAAVSLVDLSTMRRIFAVERRDAVLVIIAALGVISVPADMLLVRPRSEIFFANFQHFRRDVYAALAANDPRPTVLLIDGSGLFIFEFAGHQALREMIADLRSAGLEIWAVLPPGSAEDAVMRFRRIFGPEDIRLFPSAADAVATHLDQLGGPTDSG
jgi:MFS superfamily sulfate permease-like transporter